MVPTYVPALWAGSTGVCHALGLILTDMAEMADFGVCGEPESVAVSAIGFVFRLRVYGTLADAGAEAVGSLRTHSI